jgi:hypothetical protein
MMAKAPRVSTKSVCIALGIYLTAMMSPVLATNYYVKTNGSDSANGLSWTTAFATMGKAITVSANGDVVDVNEGTYVGALTSGYSGKRIHVRSTNPTDPNVVAATIIDAGSPATNVVRFVSGETSQSILDGFTLTGGSYAVACGSGTSSCPTVVNCIMRDNATGGFYAAISCSATVRDCQMINNGTNGVFAYGNSSSITGCRITGNGSLGLDLAYSGGFSGVLRNCVIANNGGYGIRFNTGSTVGVENCTIVGHTTAGISGSCGPIKNCIVWTNHDDLSNCVATYSCIGDLDLNPGNIHGDPMFIDAAHGDYHLWSTSPCVDMGDPSSSYANEPNGGGGRIDMGAYGNTSEAAILIDTDGDGLDDRWEAMYWPGDDLNLHGPNDDPDGDGLRNIDEHYAGLNPTSNDSGSIVGLVCNPRADVNYPSITSAILHARDNDELILSSRTYAEMINFSGKPIRVRSTDPNNPTVVAATIINPNNSTVTVVGFGSGETTSSVLDGVTVRGGKYGVYCTLASSPRLTHCVFRNNSYHGIYTRLGSSPLIEDSQILSNSSYGIHFNGGSSAQVVRCRVLSNSSYGIYGNVSYTGTIRNCVVARNTGGGIGFVSSPSANIINCAIASNTSYGINGACARVTNCIVWGNGDDLVSCAATYSCIEDPDTGVGIIHILPMFVNAANDDYHLCNWSRCIDSGDPSSDYSLEPDGGGGRINMGAYGNTSEAETLRDVNGDGIPAAWLEYFWPGYDPNNPIYSAAGNPDMDDFNNVVEYWFGYAPNQTTQADLTLIVDLSVPGFDPTNQETSRTTYLINRAVDATITITNTSTGEVVYRRETPESAGRHEVIWDGCDTNGQIVEHGTYSITISANDGMGHVASSTLTVALSYVYDIVNLHIDPSCFIPANNEVVTVAYQLTADADMVVEVYDPQGALWCTLLDNIGQSQGAHEVIWQGRTKPLGDPQGRWVSQEGVYTIRIRFAGMREKEECTVRVCK